MDCAEKIDFLCGKVKGAVVWEELDNMKESLLISKAWKDWLTEMTLAHDPKAPLRAQGKFSELLTTAQSILVENKNDPGAEPLCFRNLRDESIDFNVPHHQRKILRALRPDFAVVRKEHLDLVPLRHDQSLCHGTPTVKQIIDEWTSDPGLAESKHTNIQRRFPPTVFVFCLYSWNEPASFPARSRGHSIFCRGPKH